MKKFLAIFCSVFLIANPVYATGLFIGGDILHSNSRHEAKNHNAAIGSDDGAITKGNQSSYGFNAGIRLDVLFLLASAELFYDKLNISAKEFASATNSGEQISLDYRYGAKASVGMAVFPRITTFVSAGLTDIHYKINGSSFNSRQAKSEFTPIYGLGLLVDLPFGITGKAAYDYQELSVTSPVSGAKIKTHLGTARLGVVYNF